MYFPYLRGRQFEMIALREYAAQKGEKNNIIPIIEPVKNTFNTMKRALAIMSEHNVKYAIILNPCVGDIAKDKTMTIERSTDFIMESLSAELQDTSRWFPTYILTDNYSEILSQINNNDFNNVMIICSDSTDVNNADFVSLVGSERVNYIVSEENRKLKSLYNETKKIIRLDDKYKPEKRNKDYLVKQEEKFTEEHLYYTEEGYYGFSDYTVLSNEFKEGGSLPYAVVIHLTYQKDNEVWISHFTSETNDDQSNIQGKFAEALAKAVEFLKTTGLSNSSITELKEYYSLHKYPGLGVLKKIAVKNHLELMNSLI